METCCAIDDQSLLDVVVEETSTIPEFFVTSLVSTDFSHTVPLNLTFYKKDENSYAVLERHKITSILNLYSHLKVTTGGLINKITLLDFPHGQYTLSLNGHNCATAKYNKEMN